jgi:S-adenosylhomocysteine hydrolase
MKVEGARPIAHRHTAPQAAPKAKAAAHTDAFKHQALPSFASFFPESKKVPTLPHGKTSLQTFTQAQVQALHRAYWSAPATAALADMVHLALKDPAFKGTPASPRIERQVGLVFADLPQSFPWGWRSRALAATTHTLVEALLTHPKGTAFTAVVAELQKHDKDFPGVQNWQQSQRRAWVEEPERFPFVDKLPKEGKYHVLEAQGEAPEVRKDVHGRFTVSEALAKQVRVISLSADIGYDCSDVELAKIIDGKLGGGGAFTPASLKNLRSEFPKLVPLHPAVHAAAAKRLAENIRRIYDNEHVTSATQMMALVKERFGVDMSVQTLAYLRETNGDLVPRFGDAQDDAAWATARQLLDAIGKNPKAGYTDVGAGLGLDKQHTQQMLRLIHRRWPDELPALQHRNWTAADRAALQKLYDSRELGENAHAMFERFKVEAPELYERFPYENDQSFYVTLREQLGVPPLSQTRVHQYLSALADVAKRSSPGTQLNELVALLQDENRYAYGLSMVNKILVRVHEHPNDYPELAKVRDTHGKLTWEKSKIEMTEALARRVGDLIAKNPGRTHRWVAAELMRDRKFAEQYPTFDYEQIHHLRGVFPKLVPYIDDLKLAGRDNRIAAYHKALERIGDRIEAAAAKVKDPGGLTVAELGRRLKLKPSRVISAIRYEPGRFPWYQERPAGQVDLFLATRVAAEMSKAPLGATLGDVQEALQKDPRFRDRYPAFGYLTFQTLRERYPDIVPQWSTRDQVLRSKLLSDAVRDGASFKQAAAKLHFDGRWADEGWVHALWASDPELFAFTKKPTKEDPPELADRLAKLERIPERLPLLDKLGPLAHKEYFADYEVLGVQHMLGSQVALFDAFRKLGLKPDRTSIVAIPYSASEPVVETLQDKGWDVRVPPLDLEQWYGMVKDALGERIAAAKKSGRKVLVLDDGGLTTMMFDKYPELAKDKHLVKIVEQTRRGITVADGSKLGSPVIDVAQSWGKYVEGPMIGNSLQAKLVSRLNAIGLKNLKGKHVGVVGYGTIGAPLAHFLKSIGAHVTVLDLGDEAKKQAAHAGFAVANDRKAFFSQQDVIVGATGVRSMTAEDLAELKDGAIIGSGSSKLVEIDVDALAGKPEIIDARSHPPTVRYTGKDGRRITLLAKGFPLNFDGSVEDIEPERIQLTRGLMLIGALQAAGMSAAGVHRLDPDLQLKLLHAFESVGGRKVGGREVVEALDLAKDNLGHLKRKHGDLEHDRRHREA